MAKKNSARVTKTTTALSLVSIAFSASASGQSNRAPANESRAIMENAPALDGSGLIPLDLLRRIRFSLGATTSAGVDSNPQDLSRASSSFVYNLSPYLALETNTHRSDLILQYQPTISHYTGYDGTVMHLASASYVDNLNQRWTLVASANGSHGQDSTRFLAPAQSVVVGGVSGTSTNAASYLPDAGTVTDLDSSITVSGQLSERRAARITLSNSYSSIPSLKETNSVATAKIVYEYALKPTLTLQAYQRSSQYYGTLSCTSFGAGAGVHWQPREGTFLALSAGPEIDTPVCKAQQGISYNLSFSTKLPQRAQLYLQAAREPATGYLGPGLWQDSITAGYQRQIARFSSIEAHVGFVQSSSLFKISSYQGTYWDSTYAYKLLRGPSFSLGYRTFFGSSGSTNYNRNIMLVAVSWTPNASKQAH